jgi:hypothetical protein
VTLTGSNFNGTTGVTVDGKPLTAFPPEYTSPNDNTLIISFPLQDHLGPIEIKVTNASGTSTTTVNVIANTSPTLDLIGSNPGFLFQGIGMQNICGSAIADLFILVGSPELIPTVVPGIANMAIGNNYNSIFILGSEFIPPKGWVEIITPMAGLPTGLQLHVQGAVLTGLSLYTFPTVPSNVQSGTILF